MPRLLLVDDNPSIHKIAETLLAASSIELVCVDSAAAALEKVNRGEAFDVALVDTSMAGIDGWSLVEMLRGIPATARIPIAMMAGVLDTVDPERIREAPIQGFLKKPVELRELGDRIARLLDTPVPFADPPPLPPRSSSPFATMPATRLDELPEFRPKQTAVAPPSEEDLLELTEEDLYLETQEPRPVTPEESLDLEELDLDSLRGLAVQPEKLPVQSKETLGFMAMDLAASEPTPQEAAWPLEELDAISTLDRLPAAVEAVASAEVELPDLGAPTEELVDITSLGELPEIGEAITEEPVPLASLVEAPGEEVSFTPPLPPLEESLDWSDDSDSMLSTVETFEAPVGIEAPVVVESLKPASAALPEDDLDLLDISMLSAVETFEAPVAVASLEPAPPILPEDNLDLLDVSIPELVPEPNPLQLDLDETAPILDESPALEVHAPALDVESTMPASAEPAGLPVVEPFPAEVPAASQPAPGFLGAKEMLDAMMCDPVLMDALAKAVVARLGDQVLREIAWEVMPELAERLPRN